MSILVIGPDEEARIERAIKVARKRPIPWSVMQQFATNDPKPELRLSDRKGPAELARAEYPPQQLMLGTYRAALSFEQQPAGLFRHLSVSSHNPGKVPGPEVMQMVCEAFGFSKIVCDAFANPRGKPVEHAARIWAEEFDPGHYAINVVELEGHDASPRTD